jgi:hypothetical protein
MTTSTTDKLLTRELSLPATVNFRMRQHALASGSSLGADLARIVEAYADGRFDGAEGRINLATAVDPGAQPTDKRTKFVISEAVWEQARIRSIQDETSVQAAIRTAATALNADA